MCFSPSFWGWWIISCQPLPTNRRACIFHPRFCSLNNEVFCSLLTLWMSFGTNSPQRSEVFAQLGAQKIDDFFEILAAKKPASINLRTHSIYYTLQGTNISHLRKGKIIFKSALGVDMLVPRKVFKNLNDQGVQSPNPNSKKLAWFHGPGKSTSINKSITSEKSDKKNTSGFQVFLPCMEVTICLNRDPPTDPVTKDCNTLPKHKEVRLWRSYQKPSGKLT